MNAYDEEFNLLLPVEGNGAYSNRPADAGGPTRWGVTEKVARESGYKGDMKDLPRETAHEIAKARYWDVLRLDDVAQLSRPLAHELFDTGYNMGIGTAGRFLQRALNVFNRRGRDFPDVVVDNVVGLGTVAALRAFLKLRGSQGETVLLRALNAQQGCRYIEIAERRELDEENEFGWFANRVST